MSQRFFESEKHVALYVQFRPIPPQKLTEKIVNFLKEKYQGSLSTCVDVGCGNGQCTDLFQSYFEKVIGIDVSPAQIEAAKKMNHSPNVEFWVGPAEEIPVDSGSVQVVNALMAAHWFNLPAFFEETKRILCTNGVVALSCYSLDSFDFVHPSKSKELHEEFKKLYVEQLSPFYGAASLGIKHTLSGYADLKIPFEESVRCEIWTEEKPVTIAALADLVSTTYPYQELCRKHGDEAGKKMLDEYQSKCDKILDISKDTESTELKLKIKYFLLMGRKI